jgi:hypothetical protein
MSGDSSKPTPITREKLLEGRTYGTHVLSEPLIGYKKVNCTTSTHSKSFLRNFFSLEKDKEVHEKCIAKVELPPKATVIRPYTKDPYHGHISVCEKLRTNDYKVLEIDPLKQDFFRRKVVTGASSVKFSSFKYEEGKSYSAILNENENEPCSSGLHFFLGRKAAEDYMF